MTKLNDIELVEKNKEVLKDFRTQYKLYCGEPIGKLLGGMKITISSAMRYKKYSHVYIGATSDIQDRFLKYNEWAFKHVLFCTEDFESAKYVETTLIKYIKKFNTCNEIDVSINLDKDKPIYFIYFLMDKCCKKRD